MARTERAGHGTLSAGIGAGEVKRRIFALLAVAVLLLPASGAAENRAEVLEEFDAYLDKTAQQLGDSPFGAVVSKGGEIIFERYYAANGVLGREVDADSRWQIFSITKSFISALVLNLCRDGLVTLDDPVGKYLPAFSEHGEGLFDRRAVTFRHLLSHTSGAAYEGNLVPNPLPPGLERIDIVHQPGTVFKYSGLGMMILERALEAATGKGVETLLHERITGPLKLGSTGYVYPGTASDRVLPLKRDLFHYSQNGKRAGAGLFTTARDLNAFGRLWLEPKSMFSPDLRAEAWTLHGIRESDSGRYGLMWWLFEEDGGFVMSGKENKINAVVPETGVVVTVIRYPQDRAAKEYRFVEDKRAMVLFGKRL
jgi:CubicO group peptidase (beta-lactamase class C family)